MLPKLQKIKSDAAKAASLNTATEPVPINSAGLSSAVQIGVGAAVVGLFIGYLMRPAAPLIGQLDFETVISRGSNLRGLDQLLVSTAQTSFNYMLVGGLVFGLVGMVIGSVLSSKKASVSAINPERHLSGSQPTFTQSASPKTVELGYSPIQVEAVLGPPETIIDLGTKLIHVYKELKITFVDGKVSDVQ